MKQLLFLKNDLTNEQRRSEQRIEQTFASARNVIIFLSFCVSFLQWTEVIKNWPTVKSETENFPRGMLPPIAFTSCKRFQWPDTEVHVLVTERELRRAVAALIPTQTPIEFTAVNICRVLSDSLLFSDLTGSNIIIKQQLYMCVSNELRALRQWNGEFWKGRGLFVVFCQAPAWHKCPSDADQTSCKRVSCPVCLSRSGHSSSLLIPQ